MHIQLSRFVCSFTETAKYQIKYDQSTGNVSLLILNIGPGDEGEYTCTAVNQFGEAICTVYIQPEGGHYCLSANNFPLNVNVYLTCVSNLGMNLQWPDGKSQLQSAEHIKHDAGRYISF